MTIENQQDWRTRRWLRPNAQRDMRPDAWRYLKPGTPGSEPPPGIGYQEPAYAKAAREQLALAQAKAAAVRAEDDERAFQRELASIRLELALFKLAEKAHQAAFRSDMARWRAANARGFQRVRAMLSAKDGLKSDLKAGFRPDQPRDDHGRWSDEGGHGEEGERLGHPEDESSATATDLSANSRKGGDGHHYIPRGVYRKYALSEEAIKVFEEAKTGLLFARRSNLYDSSHRAYNLAVDEAFSRFLHQQNITAERMTADHARGFVRQILESTDPRVRRFNMRIQMREIMFRLLRGMRGRE